MKRKIIEIDGALCNGCTLCVSACHEGAIQMVEGKAKLISDAYCDGLGDCLPECPTGAIRMIEREADPYDEELVLEKIKERDQQDRMKDQGESAVLPCGCPGMEMKSIQRQGTTVLNTQSDQPHETTSLSTRDVPSELSQWPVQLKLIHPQAPYLQRADLLIAADCTAFAYGDFHRDFMKDKITLIGCPKLDDNQYYQEKLADIFRTNQPKSITVVRMQVPCCGGIVSAVQKAMLEAQLIVPYQEVTISTDGQLLQR